MRAAEVLSALAVHDSELGQVLGLLRASAPEREPESLPLGAGDRRLLALHRALTGRDVELTVACGACGMLNELLIAVEALPAPVSRVAVCGSGGGVREPTYGDLVGLPGERSAALAELLRRCTVGAPSRPPRAEDLELVDDSLAGPLGSTCAGCGGPLEALLDVQRVVLELLQRQLVLIDHETDVLARAYHWDLAAIEALPDERRTRLARLAAEDR